MTNFIRPSRAILAAALFAVGAGSVLANSVIYQDSFTTPGTGRGGPYVSSIAGATTTTGGGTWLAGVETSGWGQTGGGRATPTSSNFLAFTPDPGRIYTVQATIDSTGAAGWGDSWFTLGFTSFQHNWTGADGATIDTNDLVRFNQARVATITYTVSGATLSAAGVGYVGWITDNPGNVNLDPNNQQVKITHFSLFSGVANPTITYNGNGSDGGTVPADGSSPFVYGATVTVPGAGSMTRADYAFIGWNTAADGGGMSYSPGGTFTLYDNITLYAKWLPNNYVVLTYDGNGSTGGGAPVDPSSPYLTGSAVTVLGTGSLSKTSHSFAHWNTSADGSGTSYNPNETFTINSSTTLHAQWTPGPDYLWDNGGNSYAWNTTDANWAGAAWGNSASHNALFTTVGGAIMLDAITAGNVDVGAVNANFPATTLSGGSLASVSLTVQGSAANSGNYAANPTFSVNSDVTISGDLAVGRANFQITGGTLTANRIISSAASADWGRLAIYNGTLTATNGVDGSVHTGATFQLDLNGGELRTPSIRVADREDGWVNNAWLTFNGGKVTVIGADNGNFITLYGGNQNCYVGAGGAMIDTNNFNIGIGVNLTAAGAGGLTKQGAGTLTLSGTNTYSGDTTVEAGSLVLASGGSSRFYPAANGVSNKITGTGNPAVNLDGEIYLDLAAANLTDGNTWLIVDAAHVAASYGGTFGVNSSLGAFTNHAGVWSLTQGGSVWTFAQATGQLDFLQTTDAFLGWIDATWPTLSDKSPTGDPDHDGIPNLLEYVLQNGDPSVGSTAILPTSTTTATDFVFTFHRRAASTIDTTQTFEYSDNLTVWSALAIPGGTGVVVTDIGGGIDEVIVTVPRGSNTTLFGRLAVTKP